MSDNQTQIEAQNKNLIYRYINEVWNHENFGLVDELFADDYIIHVAGMDLESSHETLKENLMRAHLTFPDFHMALKHLVADGKLVMAHWINTGTHTGELKLPGMEQGIPPSGNKINFMEVAIFRLENGKIAKGWYISDQLGMMQQIGMIPSE